MSSSSWLALEPALPAVASPCWNHTRVTFAALCFTYQVRDAIQYGVDSSVVSIDPDDKKLLSAMHVRRAKCYQLLALRDARGPAEDADERRAKARPRRPECAAGSGTEALSQTTEKLSAATGRNTRAEAVKPKAARSRKRRWLLCFAQR